MNLSSNDYQIEETKNVSDLQVSVAKAKNPTERKLTKILVHIK